MTGPSIEIMQGTIERLHAPWQVALFGLVMHMIEARRFSCAEWTSALTEQVRAADIAGGATQAGYFECFLRALEQLSVRNGWIQSHDIDSSKPTEAHQHHAHSSKSQREAN